MELSQLNKITIILCVVFWLIFKVFYVYAIYFNCKANKRKNTDLYIIGSVLFPIITGIVCLCDNKKAEKNKDYRNGLILFILAVIMLAASVYSAYYGFTHRYYDIKGNGYAHFEDVTFYDNDGNAYNYDFDKHGYDYLYINGTQEKLNADLCYLDENGLLYYDEKMNIVAKDNASCADENGNIYYPVKYSEFNKDKSISYEHSLFSYDREGNAYTYDYVPYYDKEGNKYSYSFDSDMQKGTYTNVNTGDEFNNEYCFVDENGYFVYDNGHKFVLQKNAKYSNQYMDSDRKIYYWASGISWNKNGEMLDSYGEIIE